MADHTLQFLWFCLVLVVMGKTENEPESASNRQHKLLNPFNIISFPNDVCTTKDGTYTKGTCFSSSECSGLGGTNSGTCASGFGVCCYFLGQCGGSTSVNNTYFVSQSTDTSPCGFDICRTSSDICQLKLTFDTFVTAQPVTKTTTGSVSSRTQCLNSQFSATSEGSSSPFSLCGTNTGYHLYLEAESDCNTLLNTWTSDTSRSYVIHIAQISCSAEWKAPEGCSQYHTGTSGTINSYNFQKSVHLANQHDKVCIRTELNYCGIYYSPITMGVGGYPTSATLATAIAVGYSGTSCTTDYLTIPNGLGVNPAPSTAYTSNQGKQQENFCGIYMSYSNPAPATTGATSTVAASITIFTSQMPFQVGFTTDGVEQDNNSAGTTLVEVSTGYQLYWAQTKDNC